MIKCLSNAIDDVLSWSEYLECANRFVGVHDYEPILFETVQDQ